MASCLMEAGSASDGGSGPGSTIRLSGRAWRASRSWAGSAWTVGRMRRRCARALVGALADPSPEVRERAVEVLASAGPHAVRRWREQLEAADPQLPQDGGGGAGPPSIPASTRPWCAAHTSTAICAPSTATWAAWKPWPAAPPGVAVLGRALRERNATLLEEIFYLLATIQDPVAVKTIANLAWLSPLPEVRANATEALESLTSPQNGRPGRPLFEPDGSLPPGQLASLGGQTWDPLDTTPAAATARASVPGGWFPG